MTKEFKMTQEQLDKLLVASQPTPAMYLPGGKLMFSTPQENANRAWLALGNKMGFDHMTVKPCPKKGDLFFFAKERTTL